MNKLSKRKNVVLIGDFLGDLKIADSVKDPDGFLNKNIEESLEIYKKNLLSLSLWMINP